jgi:DNA-binding NarL/FixJ family response regulator
MQYSRRSTYPHGTDDTINRETTSQASGAYTIVIADPHAVIRDGMQRLLDSELGLRVIATVANSETVVDLVRRFRPDLLLFDFGMFSALHILQQVSTIADTAVVLFTADLHHDEAVLAVRLGVRGILSKDAPVETVVQCIGRVLAGEHWIERELLAEAARESSPNDSHFDLSVRELEIIRSIVMTGACNKEVAQRLGISDLTVKRHLTNIYNKTGVTGRLELALFALANNLACLRKPAATVVPAAPSLLASSLPS